MRAPALLLLAFPLLACSAAPGWQKPGVADEQRDRDNAACRSEARAATRRDANIDADIMASRGQDWGRSDVLQQKREEMRMSTTARAEDVFDRCMRAHGYAPVR
jgi:hypothetical protein